MQAPDLPAHEAARLQALRDLRILDTAPETRFDRVVGLAARLFEVPIALVSLVDEDRQWFKARVGLGATQTSREISFCGHAVAMDRALVVPDTVSDARFSDNPLVVGDPHIRFYAGEPLRSPEGLAVGTLCLIDSRPRELNPDQAALLRELADLVEQELWHQELREKEEALRSSEARYRAMVEALQEGVVLQGPGGILATNTRAAEILGLRQEELLGLGSVDPRWRAIHEDGSPWPGETHPAMVALRTGLPQRDQIIGIHRPDGALCWLLLNANPTGPDTVLVSFSDITRQREVSERLRVIFEQSADAHLLFDETGIIDCNAAAVAMLRCPDKAHLLSLHPSALSPEFQPDGSRSDLPTTWREDQARAQGSCRFEWLHRTQDGHDFLTEVSLTPVLLNGKEAFLEVWHDLTERKKYEDAIRDSEQQVRFLLEHTTDLIARHDPEGRFTFVTPSVASILGYAPEDLLGRRPTDFQDPEDRPQLREAYKLLLGGSSLSSFRFPVRHRDGRRVWLESQGNPVLGPGGRLQEVVITTRDVSERVASEQALQASEARFRTMVEALHEAVFIVDRKGRVLAPNRRAKEMLGIAPETAEGLTTHSLSVETFHEDGSPCPPEQRPSSLVFKNGEAQRQQVLGLRRQDGQHYWILVNAEPMRQGGEVQEVIVSFADITALRESEARTRAMVEAIPDELFRQDRAGIYLDVHSKDPNLPYLPREALLGRGMEELLGTEVAAKRLEAIHRALATGRVQVLEYSLSHRGLMQEFEARVVPYGSDETITIIRDITARNAADRLKREFVSIVSHELRTPLTAIRGALGMLAVQQGDLPPQAREMLDIAIRNGQRLLGLLNDILDLDKVEQGTLDFQLECVPLLPLVEQAVETLRPYAQGMEGDYLLAVDSDGPVRVDGNRMLQVLTNLLGNAAKFSPRGEPVQVRLRCASGRVHVEVENGGPGIPPEFHPRIFQKFAQADGSDARRYPGTGLGLAISKALVEHMGGEIGFRSEPGSTVFTVDFPLVETP